MPHTSRENKPELPPRKNEPPPRKHNLFAPLPLRLNTELGRVLYALEVPEHCACPKRLACLAGCHGYPEECPGDRSCDCKLAPCECVGAEADHEVPVEMWLELLRGYDLRGYAGPPAAEPAVGDRKVLSREARVALYAGRAAAGLAILNPGDAHCPQPAGAEERDPNERVGVRMAKKGVRVGVVEDSQAVDRGQACHEVGITREDLKRIAVRSGDRVLLALAGREVVARGDWERVKGEVLELVGEGVRG